MNYYNEFDPFAAQMLRNLIEAGHIAPGVVDERSIEDVKPNELLGYTQCHFFAGVGVWSLALRRAGWPDDRKVWTGSCPCQPFSAAGKGNGFADERHLWPAFYHLIRQCQPPVVYGEQVASAAVDPWIDLVQADLEALGYSFGCVPFPSASVGAPHIRDRAYWVGNTNYARLEGYAGHGGAARWTGAAGSVAPTGLSGGLANGFSVGCDKAWFGHAAQERDGIAGDGGLVARQPQSGPVNGLWADADWLFCRDGKWRPVEPGTFPLAHGATARVGRLRGYGNAINAYQAQVFIETHLRALSGAVIEPMETLCNAQS